MFKPKCTLMIKNNAVYIPKISDPGVFTGFQKSNSFESSTRMYLACNILSCGDKTTSRGRCMTLPCFLNNKKEYEPEALIYR